MRETKGRADGGEVTRIVREKLGLWAPGPRRGAAATFADSPRPRRSIARMSRLIRMDHTGHTTLAEWTADDPRRSTPRSAPSARSSTRATSAMVSTGEGHAEQVRELPLDAELVIMRLPISGG